MSASNNANEAVTAKHIVDYIKRDHGHLGFNKLHDAIIVDMENERVLERIEKDILKEVNYFLKYNATSKRVTVREVIEAIESSRIPRRIYDAVQETLNEDDIYDLVDDALEGAMRKCEKNAEDEFEEQQRLTEKASEEIVNKKVGKLEAVSSIEKQPDSEPVPTTVPEVWSSKAKQAKMREAAEQEMQQFLKTQLEILKSPSISVNKNPKRESVESNSIGADLKITKNQTKPSGTSMSQNTDVGLAHTNHQTEKAAAADTHKNTVSAKKQSAGSVSIKRNATGTLETTLTTDESNKQPIPASFSESDDEISDVSDVSSVHTSDLSESDSEGQQLSNIKTKSKTRTMTKTTIKRTADAAKEGSSGSIGAKRSKLHGISNAGTAILQQQLQIYAAGSSIAEDGGIRYKYVTDVTVLNEHDTVQALDAGEWYIAIVKKISQSKNQVLVHFNGWSKKYDQWLQLSKELVRIPTA